MTWGGCPCQGITLYVDPCLPPFLSHNLACCCVQQASWLPHSWTLSCLHCSALQEGWSRTWMLARSSLCELWVFTSRPSGFHSSVSLALKDVSSLLCFKVNSRTHLFLNVFMLRRLACVIC